MVSCKDVPELERCCLREDGNAKALSSLLLSDHESFMNFP